MNKHLHLERRAGAALRQPLSVSPMPHTPGPSKMHMREGLQVRAAQCISMGLVQAPQPQSFCRSECLGGLKKTDDGFLPRPHDGNLGGGVGQDSASYEASVTNKIVQLPFVRDQVLKAQHTFKRALANSQKLKKAKWIRALLGSQEGSWIPVEVAKCLVSNRYSTNICRWTNGCFLQSLTV